MSAPIRVKVEDEKIPTAEAIRAEQPTQQPADLLTPADSDLKMETPRIMFPDQLVSQHLAENPGAVQKNEHASGKPRVVRTLKDPPEIWDLVHEIPGQFNPAENFVARLTSTRTNLILLLVLGVMFISSLSAFAVITLRDGRKRGVAAAQVHEERGTGQTVPASQASALESAPVVAPASAPESALNAPVNTPVNTSPSDPASVPDGALNAQVNTSPGAEPVLANTALTPTTPPLTDSQPTTPQPTVPSPDCAAVASQALTDSTQPTGESESQAKANGPVVKNIPKRTASRASRAAAWSRNNLVKVASGWQNANNPGNRPADKPADKPSDKPNPARAANTAAGRDTSAKRQSSQERQTADLKRAYEKSSRDSASANKGSSTTLSPQLIAPPTTTSAPKAKVIQWP
ncbi:MAG: hypothetical protein ABJB97_09050 [Acidobacteriota bacterium]